MADSLSFNLPVCACLEMRKAGRVLTQIYDQYLRPAGIRGTQFAVLLRVSALEGPSVTDLGLDMGMDQTTATRNLELLERQGYVFLEAHPEDARKKQIRLTPEGRSKLEQAIPLWQEAQRGIQDRLGKENMDSLLSMLSDLVRVVK